MNQVRSIDNSSPNPLELYKLIIIPARVFTPSTLHETHFARNVVVSRSHRFASFVAGEAARRPIARSAATGRKERRGRWRKINLQSYLTVFDNETLLSK